jgi:hypothetical protein
MTWLRPVDRTSGTLTLSAGTLSCLAHHGTLLSERCPTTTALEHTTVPMDNANRMSPLGAVKPRQRFFDVIHRAQCVARWNSGTSAARRVTGILSGRPNSEVPFWSRWARVAVRDFVWGEDRNGSFTSFPPSRRVRFAPRSGHSANARVYEYAH